MARKFNAGNEAVKVCNWNQKHAVGQVVDVRMDSGEVRRTKTRSRAELLSGHTAVIWLEGISGCYCLDRVTAVEQDIVAKAEEQPKRDVVAELVRHVVEGR